MSRNATVSADWWERPTVRPTSPAIERDMLPTPTQVPPTSQPTQVQPSPTSSPVGGLPTATPTNVPGGGGGGSTTDDPCASGKSFTGSYCGWSPGVGAGGGATVDGGSSRIGGPQVLGLSKTSSGDLELSDIILLTGVLCLLLYLRSKLSPVMYQ